LMTTLVKAIAENTAEAEAAKAQLNGLRAQLRTQSEALDAATTRAEVVKNAVAAIESFLTSLRTVPEDAERSPLAAATLHEQLHLGAGDSGFTHVLLIQSQNGSVQQVVDDKPLWWKDKYSVVAMAAVTYLLLRLPEGDIVAGGTAHGTAVGKGAIGGGLTIDVS
jgi:hypothetical protein